MPRMTVKSLSDRIELLNAGVYLYVDKTRRAYNNGSKYSMCFFSRPILCSNTLQELSDRIDEWVKTRPNKTDK
jgi:hypothetical protein